MKNIPTTMLQIGDKMPAFSAADETGKIVTNNDLIGKPTVIYFYPKDSTPGCTAEACNIRDNYHAFLAQGYQVYGVSKDSQAFAAKPQVKHLLTIDPNAHVQVFPGMNHGQLLVDHPDEVAKRIVAITLKNHSVAIP